MNKNIITCSAKDCVWAKPVDPDSRICRCTSEYVAMVRFSKATECITYEEKKGEEQGGGGHEAE